MSRNVIMKFRVSEDEAERITKKALRAKMKTAPYLRRQALDGEVKVFDMGSVNELALQIHRIGVNINQIASLVNQSKVIYRNDIETLGKDFSEMKESIDFFLRKFERDNTNENE